MSKKENIEENIEEKTEKEKRIEELKNEIRQIKMQGSFSEVYTEIRKGTVEINKKDLKDSEKKEELKNLCNKIIAKIEIEG